MKLDGANAFKIKSASLYGEKQITNDFSNELKVLVKEISTDSKFDRYYNNKKEGYYQNELSRKFGMFGTLHDDFVIIDKEAVIGYEDMDEKNRLFGEIRTDYKKLQKQLSQSNVRRYGKNLDKRAIGNELDFLALNKQGDLLLIEYKHGTNTSGIYLSPLQIGMYFDLFCQFPIDDMKESVKEMIEQKKRIGLINSEWETPEIRNIVPVLIISEHNYRSTAKVKYEEVMAFTRRKKGNSFLQTIKTFNYSTKNGMTPW